MSLILLGILNSQAAAAAGGATSYDLLETTVLSSTSDSITFTNIDTYTDYKHLQVRQVVAGASSTVYASMRLNSDTGTNYWYNNLYTTGNSVDRVRDETDRISTVPSLPVSSNQFSCIIWDILDFSNTNKYTNVRYAGGWYTASNRSVFHGSATWENTAALTDITLFDQFTNGYSANSRFSLYGVKG
jgi:hypothetical protein